MMAFIPSQSPSVIGGIGCRDSGLLCNQRQAHYSGDGVLIVAQLEGGPFLLLDVHYYFAKSHVRVDEHSRPR